MQRDLFLNSILGFPGSLPGTMPVMMMAADSTGGGSDGLGGISEPPAAPPSGGPPKKAGGTGVSAEDAMHPSERWPEVWQKLLDAKELFGEGRQAAFSKLVLEIGVNHPIWNAVFFGENPAAAKAANQAFNDEFVNAVGAVVLALELAELSKQRGEPEVSQLLEISISSFKSITIEPHDNKMRSLFIEAASSGSIPRKRMLALYILKRSAEDALTVFQNKTASQGLLSGVESLVLAHAFKGDSPELALYGWTLLNEFAPLTARAVRPGDLSSTLWREPNSAIPFFFSAPFLDQTQVRREWRHLVLNVAGHIGLIGLGRIETRDFMQLTPPDSLSTSEEAEVTAERARLGGILAQTGGDHDATIRRFFSKEPTPDPATILVLPDGERILIDGEIRVHALIQEVLEGKAPAQLLASIPVRVVDYLVEETDMGMHPTLLRQFLSLGRPQSWGGIYGEGAIAALAARLPRSNNAAAPLAHPEGWMSLANGLHSRCDIEHLRTLSRYSPAEVRALGFDDTDELFAVTDGRREVIDAALSLARRGIGTSNGSGRPSRELMLTLGWLMHRGNLNGGVALLERGVPLHHVRWVLDLLDNRYKATRNARLKDQFEAHAEAAIEALNKIGFSRRQEERWIRMFNLLHRLVFEERGYTLDQFIAAMNLAKRMGFNEYNLLMATRIILKGGEAAARQIMRDCRGATGPRQDEALARHVLTHDYGAEIAAASMKLHLSFDETVKAAKRMRAEGIGPVSDEIRASRVTAKKAPEASSARPEKPAAIYSASVKDWTDIGSASTDRAVFTLKAFHSGRFMLMIEPKDKSHPTVQVDVLVSTRAGNLYILEIQSDYIRKLPPALQPLYSGWEETTINALIARNLRLGFGRLGFGTIQMETPYGVTAHRGVLPLSSANYLSEVYLDVPRKMGFQLESNASWQDGLTYPYPDEGFIPHHFWVLHL